jgi:signal transduction histidine kinase
MLSHELRTPLTPVLAASGALAADDSLPDATREDLAMIRRNVMIQSRLIDDLLDLTRIERRRLDLVSATLPARRPCCATPPPSSRPTSMRASRSWPCNATFPTTGASPATRRASSKCSWNLLQNATKFSPPRTTIRCTARVLPGTTRALELAIEDEGPGIPAGEFERIFRPFEQIRNIRRVGRETGLGLGLAIARAIVDLHGGVLAVGPGAGGRGTRFTVELPLVPASVPARVFRPRRDRCRIRSRTAQHPAGRRPFRHRPRDRAAAERRRA